MELNEEKNLVPSYVYPMRYLERKNESKSDVKHLYRKIQLVAGHFKKTAIKNIKLYYGL